jgi:hypothetical protein
MNKALLKLSILKKDKNTLETSFVLYNPLTYIYLFCATSIIFGLMIVDKNFQL